MKYQESYQYLPYDEKDQTYFGCREVIQAEWGYIRKRRENQHSEQAAETLPEEEDQLVTTAAPEQDGRGRWWLRFTEVFTHTVRRRLPGPPPQPENEIKTKLTEPPPNLTGIALSGGGIRSASFCLGVLQALAYAGWLKKLDYLSTVSGGGYIGGALTWFLHKKWKGSDEKEIAFGLDRATFPFSTYPMAGMKDPNLIDDGKDRNVYKGRILRHLRQHANYLLQGHGVNFMSLIAVALCNTLFSLFVYGALLVVLLTFFGQHLFDPVWSDSTYGWIQGRIDWLPEATNMAQSIAGLVALVFFALVVVYAVLTFALPRVVGTGYNLRRSYVRLLGYLLALFLGAMALSAIPSIYCWIDKAGRSNAETETLALKISNRDATPVDITLTGQLKNAVDALPPEGDIILRSKVSESGTVSLQASVGRATTSETSSQAMKDNSQSQVGSQLRPLSRDKSGESSKWSLATLVAAISTLLGSFSAIWAFFQSSKNKPKIPTAVPVAIASIALIFGVLLLAYLLTMHLRVHLGLSIVTTPWETLDYSWLELWHRAGIALPLATIVLLFFLTFPNLNYLSLHRYYRDRLMETFTPDLPDAVDVNGAVPGAPKSADHTQLHQMLMETGENGRLGPYPIINANIVLVSSQIPKFRARGGDNFILTPKYCGSNATGWCETKNEASPYESMSVPTAIAISGAAVNSNTGSGGDGITRSPWLSFLMGFLNIRLGYWAPNPTPDKVRMERIAAGLDREILAIPQREDRPVWAYEAELVSHGLKILVLWPLKQLHMAVHHLLNLSWGTRPDEPKAVYPGLLELFMRTNLDENSQLVQLSDGGHFENLGLYELVRRRLKLIIVCDGSADPNYGFEDLANAIEKVRADFGALIDWHCPDMETLTPQSVIETGDETGKRVTYAKQGYLMGTIIYNDRTEGTLLFLTTTFFKELSPDLYAYRKAHDEFPDEPTGDQFFDEKQFEAYRELGFQTAHRMMSDDKIKTNDDVQRILGIPYMGPPDKGQ
ncbi:MAG: hypothetical protein KJ958_12075 [Gammaproteobacteria bacterium]|nr:hypothetical protein [Gammaproteobacteria bacterium]MBU1979893.1 hypothetical protein [Gammaproteobacteria bacterium]